MKVPTLSMRTRLSRIAPEILLQGEDRLRQILTQYPDTFDGLHAMRMGKEFDVTPQRALEIYKELNKAA